LHALYRDQNFVIEVLLVYEICRPYIGIVTNRLHHEIAPLKKICRPCIRDQNSDIMCVNSGKICRTYIRDQNSSGVILFNNRICRSCIRNWNFVIEVLLIYEICRPYVGIVITISDACFVSKFAGHINGSE